MKGAIIGDIIGSAFIKDNKLTTDFQLFKPISEFTDDTVLTLATADSVLNGKDYKASLSEWVLRYPDAGYKPEFLHWIENGAHGTYVSEGDGAARRISPIGFAAKSLEEALTQAKETTMITHNIPVRIEASQAAASAIFMAKNGATRKEIKAFTSVHFNYDLTLSVDYWKQELRKKELLPTPVPPAMAAFLQASDYEETIRLAIAMGGPSNTIACIAGALAHAYFKHIPKSITKRALARLTPDMELLISDFENQFMTEDAVI
jgi:ADP-ribosylglycohydrolase